MMDPGDILELTPLKLDASCCNRTNWRADLPAGADVEAVEARLVAKGYISRCHHPALRVLKHPDGHELAWVTRSGRIQIRVDLVVPRKKRRRQAEILYNDLGQCLVGSHDLDRNQDRVDFAVPRGDVA